ncbi:hypothetical protein CLU81_1286 [Flavobacterium sp. 9]|uniref:hypothetical protein n=1 Tax=Flavobacterium sp. 9 TaxID=2035198 RepID=UPI000C19B756|nr:hypothetical protein [Flavobacterium sp. 9]PIF30835.1 hypothetical protein CLU81_1286 [Flavobacterium sp. 9]
MKNGILILFCFCIISCQKQNINNDLLNKQNVSLRKTNDSLSKQLKEANQKLSNLFEEDYDASDLIKKGIVNPASFVESEFRKKELISLKAALGGKMAYENIQLLGSKFLIASYSDGHVDGKSIYSYKITDSNNLEFKIIGSE